MTKLYVVRHCEARGNIDRVFQGHTDADISKGGKKQLAFLAERFDGVKLDAIYASPLKRAQLTAQAINRSHRLPIQTEPGLIEINAGVLEMVPWGDLPKVDPESAKAWALTPHTFAPRGGESMRSVYIRIFDAVRRICLANEGKTVAAASHGAAIRCLTCRALGKPIEALNDIPWCENTGVCLFVWEHGSLKAEYVNDVSHLPDENCTLKHQNWWKPDRLERLDFSS